MRVWVWVFVIAADALRLSVCAYVLEGVQYGVLVCFVFLCASWMWNDALVLR